MAPHTLQMEMFYDPKANMESIDKKTFSRLKQQVPQHPHEVQPPDAPRDGQIPRKPPEKV